MKQDAMKWMLLYVAVWAVALLWSFISARWRHKGKLFEKIWDGGVATLSFGAGMVAVGVVTVGFNADIGGGILLVLAGGAAGAAFPAIFLGEFTKKHNGIRSSKKQSEKESCLTDTMPAWLKTNGTEKDIEKQKKIIAKLTDQNKLCEAAIYSPHEVIRHHALNKITGDNLLIKVAQAADAEALFSKAVGKINDQGFLASIVVNIPQNPLSSVFTRLAALAKLHEQASFERITQEFYLNDAYRGNSGVYNEDDNKIFQRVIEKISDTSLLSTIAMDDEACVYYRESALQNIHDQDIRYTILLHSGYGAESIDHYSSEQVAELLMNIDFTYMNTLLLHLVEKKKTISIKPDKAIAVRLLKFLECHNHAENFKLVMRFLGSRCQEYAVIQEMLLAHVHNQAWYLKANYLELLTNTEYLTDIAMHHCDEKLCNMVLENIKNPGERKTILEHRGKNTLHTWETIKNKCKKCSQCEKEVHSGGTNEVKLGQLCIDTVCIGCGKVLHSHMLD